MAAWASALPANLMKAQPVKYKGIMLPTKKVLGVFIQYRSTYTIGTSTTRCKNQGLRTLYPAHMHRDTDREETRFAAAARGCPCHLGITRAKIILQINWVPSAKYVSNFCLSITSKCLPDRKHQLSIFFKSFCINRSKCFTSLVGCEPETSRTAGGWTSYQA